MPYEWIGFGVFAVLTVLPGVPLLVLVMRRLRRQPVSRGRLAAAAAVAGIVYAGVTIDAFLIEPNWPEFEKIELTADVPRPLTILHLSDLHLEEKEVRRERWLAARLAEFQPDIAVVTGDIHQMGMHEVLPVRRMLKNIQARLGVFGCIGFDSRRILEEAAPRMRVLENETVLINDGGFTVGVCGLRETAGRDRAYEAVSTADFRLVINHTPDLADEAADNRAHLYLCGHTHGGQVRIPFWGAIITNSASGKKYEAGLYTIGKTFIYTSRGFGLEPRPAPQVRFFCRPQITLIKLKPKKK